MSLLYPPETLNDSLFKEAFHIVESNESKANSLRQILLNKLEYNNELNSEIIGYFGELEFDLKSLYDILKELKISYHDIHNALIKHKECYEKDNNINKIRYEEKYKINNNRTYSISSEKYENNKNNSNKINNYYINSPLNKKSNSILQRNTSCQSYLGNFNSEYKEIRTDNRFDKSKLFNNKYNYRNNDDLYNNASTELSLSKGKSPRLNFDYDTYFTDYPLNKTSKNNYMNYFDFLNRKNNNKKLDEINSNNSNNQIFKKDFIPKNDNNNIFTFSEQRNQNYKGKENQEFNNNENFYLNNELKTHEYNSLEKNKSPEDEEIKEIEKQKNEIIKTIISELSQDKNKLELLKKELGDDIGDKLLSGNINEKELYKVVEILKNNQENDIMKKRRIFKKKKFNQPIDKILLKDKLNNKRYEYREFPRGWNSMKEYFINNGTPLVKDRKNKK